VKLTNFQLYCVLLILVAPVAYLETPHLLIHILYANSWLAVLAATIPGLLLIQMYHYIVQKSTQPFPLILDEHLGKTLGRIVGVFYIPFFILVCSYTLRLFIEFMKMNVLPATPISVFIGVLLLVGFVAIKTGLNNIARVLEPITLVGFSFSIIILMIALFNNFHVDRILPIGYMNIRSFGEATLFATFVLGKMMPVLTLAFFIDNKGKSQPLMRYVLLTFVPLITLTTMTIIITRGILPALSLTFPVFSTIRLARIGAFIQNLDIFFVAIWIFGIFGAVTIPWFMTCYVTQQVFNLRDYRFVAAPTAILIGYLSILISRNNLEIIIWGSQIIPWVYDLFFIVIPFILFVIVLFKPYPLTNKTEPAHQVEPPPA